jgi:small conductance mechanosensitive channel
MRCLVDYQMISKILLTYAWRVFLALMIAWVGLKFIKKMMESLSKRFEKSNMEPSIASFLLSFGKAILQVLLLATIGSMLGIEVTAFVAMFASVGFAVGLAFQGSLSNFAGGVLILLLKPFKVGDFIEGAGHLGAVSEIQIFYTILNTPDNRKVIIPNAQLSNSSCINFSANTTRRIDFKFGVGYNADILVVKNILREIVEGQELILKDPQAQIVLGEHGDHALIFQVRVWCETKDYWTIYFEVLEKVKEAFDREGVHIPYPQMDVHLYSK